MKIAISIIGVFILSLQIGCNDKNPVGQIPGLYYFTFSDATKNEAMKAGNVIVERIDEKDNKIIFKTQKAIAPYPLYLATGGKKYETLFRLWEQSFNNSFYVSGNNKLRIVFQSGQIDILELNDATLSEGEFTPKQVIYNGKQIPVENSDEPVTKSFVYVLK